jgi:hypothetical protein
MLNTGQYFNIWYKSYTESFLDINKKSNIRPSWLEYSYVLDGEYGNSIIKPINHYVEKLYIKPNLLSIKNNLVVLQQTNHAEIFLLKMNFENRLKALDRPHMRQFYMSDRIKYIENNKFDQMYRFYVPWFLDIDNVKIKIKQPENSPFIIEEKEFISKKYSKNDKHVDPEMIFFNFLSNGSHMIDEEYGRIKRLSPMFNLEFDADDIIIDKIKEFYGKD